MKTSRFRSARRSACLIPLIAFGITSTIFAQPFWPQFRGPKGQSVSDDANPPVAFSRDAALWSVEVPPGHSSPCIWGDKIFISSISDNQLECRAYDRTTGRLLWVRPVPAKELERTHSFNNPAAPTAAADGERVVFYFGSYGLLCYSHDGTELWTKKLPRPVSKRNYGSSSSPILFEELVVQQLDTDEGGSRLIALKRSSGELAWETARPLFSAGWATPLLWKRDTNPELVALGSKKIVAYEPSTGKELWSAPGFPEETTPSLACDEERVFACSVGLGGRSGPKFDGTTWSNLLQLDVNKDGKIQMKEVPKDYRMVQRSELPEGHPGRYFPFPPQGMLGGMDENKDGLTQEEWTKGLSSFESIDTPVLMALEPSRGDDPVTWRHLRGIPEIPSPLCYKGKVYLIRDGGLLQCLNAKTGAVLYQQRVGASGGYAASPIAAAGRLYVTSQSGTVVVLNANTDHFDVLARNVLGEKVTATPALVQDKIYVRTDKHLLAFGGK